MTEYRTSDIGLAAALKSLGFEFISAERVDQKRYEFVFSTSDEDIEFEQIARDYQNHKVQVDALDMHDSIRSLKAQLGQRGVFTY